MKVAVVNLWASHAQRFERGAYPDWVVTQLAQFGFWAGGDGDEQAKADFARQVAALLDQHAADVAKLDAEHEALAKRFNDFGAKVERAIHTETLPGHCRFCPRFLR